MKKALLTVFLVLGFGCLYSGSVFASADVSDSILIAETEETQNVQEEPADTEEVEEVQEEKEPAQSLEEVLDGENNPITNPGGEAGVNNSSSGSKVNNRKTKKEKVKKEKKQKPKYGKYKDADTDPYIQKWEEELKNMENSGTNLNNSDGESTEQTEEQKQKTYTQDDYEQAYRDMEVPTFTFVHGIDPDQYYDMKDTTWSPYPLLRLNSPLYFKTITIPPGYYLLTPRKYKDNWYILFKEAGTVKYTIPAFERGYTPEFYYRDTLKEADMSRSARWQIKFLNAWGKYVRKSKRKPAVQCNIELTDLDNNFLLIELYYGAHKYSTIFRIEKF